MTPQEAHAAILRAIGNMATGLPATFDHGFWADIVDPVVTLIVRLRGALSDEDRALLMAIAASAMRATEREQEAHDDAAAAIRKAGGRR